jgi:hypothetical protein
MKRNVLLVICILIVFGFGLTGCSTENGAKEYSYYYEVYSGLATTIMPPEIDIYNGKDVYEYIKYQSGIPLIDKGSVPTIDDVRNLLINYGWIYTDSIISDIEKGPWVLGNNYDAISGSTVHIYVEKK